MKIFRSSALVLLTVVSLFAAPPRQDREEVAPRHVIVTAEHPLVAFERAALANEGLQLVRELGGNRYIARVSREASTSRIAALNVRSVEEVEPAQKVAADVNRSISDGAADVHVIFFPDIPFERANQIVRATGGLVKNLLATDYPLPWTVDVRVPLSQLDALAANDAVMSIHGARRVIKEHNSQAAALSHVTELYSAPYNLTGAGVVLGMWDVGSAQATHAEFEGRVILETPSAAVAEHPTHVAGTILAKGINSDAKGMAPGATLHEFNVDDGFLESKQTNYPKFGIRADNNSWGYVLGWNYDDEKTFNWEWYAGTEDFGNYAAETAGVDQLIRSTGTLAIFSAGNDDQDSGPMSSPFAHYHEAGSTVYCYSANGSGNDCPATPCARCETTRHPGDGPFNTMSLVGAAKNAIAVGAVSTSRFIAGFSSRGPATDGRVKPDVVTMGVNQMSTWPTGTYNTISGTSMAAPVVTGISALLVEQWRKSFGGDPSAEMLRALLIHGTDDLGNIGPDYTYGWGLVNAKTSVDTIVADAGSGARIRTGTLAQGASFDYKVDVTDNARITLAWSDPENTPYPGNAVVNDLDLLVVGPTGQTYLPWVLDKANPNNAATTGTNTVDTVEQVELKGVPAGTYTVRVAGNKIATSSPQSFVVLSSVNIQGARIPCLDPFEPNESATAAWGRLPSGTGVHPSICDQSDVDFFRFNVDRSGVVSVAVTATTIPLRVTLTSPSTTPVVVDVAAGSTATAQTTIGSGSNQPVASTTFTVEVQPNGTLTAESRYTLKATYPSSQSTNRRRSVHR